MSTSTSVQVTVQESGPVTRQLIVEVAAERVREARSAALAEARRRARIPGFRPGKAPENLILRTFRGDIEQSMLRVLVEGTISEAVDRVEGRVLSVREIRPEPFAEGDAPFRYEAVVEVPPAIKPSDKDWKKIKVRRPIRPVGEDDVQSVLDDLRKRYATYRPAAVGETLADGDELVLSYQATRDGKPVPNGAADHYRARLGAGQLHASFEPHLMGAAAGDRRAFDITFDESSAPSPDLVGATVHFEVEVHEVHKRVLPELDDEFAARVLDGATVDLLRERILSDLRAAAEQEAERAVESQLATALLEGQTFEVPEGVVERRRQQLAEQAAQRLMRQGYPEQSVRSLMPRLLADAEQRAERDVRLSFLLEAIAEAEGLQVTDDEVEADIRAGAIELGHNPEAYLQRVRSEGMFESIRAEIRNRKAFLKVREHAVVTDVTPEAFAAEQGEGEEATAKPKRKSSKKKGE